jgi:hypothetical protein
VTDGGRRRARSTTWGRPAWVRGSVCGAGRSRRATRIACHDNPVLATYRLEQTPTHRIARTLSAWSIGQQASIAICTALGGLLAGVTSPRTAITVAGLLILASPLLLPRREGSAPVAAESA